MQTLHTSFDKKLKIWSGLPSIPIYNPNATIGQILLESLQRQPNKIGQISDNNGIKFTNNELRLQSIRLAQNLTSLNIGKEDNIGLLAPNHHYASVVVIAALSIGSPLCALYHNLSEVELAPMLGKTNPTILFCAADKISKAKSIVKQLGLTTKLYSFDLVDDADVYCIDSLLCSTGTEDLFVPADIGDGTKHPMAILFSSGTTGQSKPTCISHADMLDACTKAAKFQSDENILSISSFHWTIGYIVFISSVINNNLRIITSDPFDADSWLRIIEKYKVSACYMVPREMAPILNSKAINNTNLSTLKYCFAGSTRIDDKFTEQFKKYLPNPLYCMYGMTEFGLVTRNFNKYKPGSTCGQLIDGISAKIINENGELCGPGENGELLLKKQYTFMGYYKYEQMTSEYVDADEWFRSGDVGYFDEDGYLYIVDRTKDVLKYRGLTILPSELEIVILKHPGVESACVVGIPDPIQTDLPAAFIIKNGQVDVTEEEIYSLVDDELSSDTKKLHGGIYFVDSFELTSTGKIIKSKLVVKGLKLLTAKNLNNA